MSAFYRCVRWFLIVLAFLFIWKEPVAAAHVTNRVITTLVTGAEQSGTYLEQAIGQQGGTGN